MTGSFGAKVIGEEAFAEQQAAAKRELDNSSFGPRVVGEAEPAAEEAEAPVTEEAAPAEPRPTLTLAELEDALESDTSIEFFDQVMAAEFERAEGPRKGGLRLLLQAENASDEPRDAVVNELTAAVEA